MMLFKQNIKRNELQGLKSPSKQYPLKWMEGMRKCDAYLCLSLQLQFITIDPDSLVETLVLRNRERPQ